MNSGPRAAASFATLMPGVSTGRRQQRLRRAHQRRPAVGRRGLARRRQHAAGLHEPGRDGLDLPGLPDVARHGQRGEGADLELRAGVRLVDLRPDHGGDQVRRQLVPRRGLRVPPRRLAEGHAVGRVGEAASSSATTTAPTSAARPSCRASGPTASRATSTSTTKATGRPAAPTSRRCRSRRCRNAPATSATGATPAAT